MRKLYVFFVVSMSLVFLIIFYSQYITYQELIETEKELQVLLEEAELAKVELELEKDNYDNNFYVEKIAREKLGFVKPSETIFINEAEK